MKAVGRTGDFRSFYDDEVHGGAFGRWPRRKRMTSKMLRMLVDDAFQDDDGCAFVFDLI